MVKQGGAVTMTIADIILTIISVLDFLLPLVAVHLVLREEKEKKLKENQAKEFEKYHIVVLADELKQIAFTSNEILKDCKQQSVFTRGRLAIPDVQREHYLYSNIFEKKSPTVHFAKEAIDKKRSSAYNLEFACQDSYQTWDSFSYPESEMPDASSTECILFDFLDTENTRYHKSLH